jgi:hypothetical protein
LVDRYVWEDEGKLTSGAPDGLADEAAQLVGELVVLLNMNEAGDRGAARSVWRPRDSSLLNHRRDLESKALA